MKGPCQAGILVTLTITALWYCLKVCLKTVDRLNSSFVLGEKELCSYKRNFGKYWVAWVGKSFLTKISENAVLVRVFKIPTIQWTATCSQVSIEYEWNTYCIKEGLCFWILIWEPVLVHRITKYIVLHFVPNTPTQSSLRKLALQTKTFSSQFNPLHRS